MYSSDSAIKTKNEDLLGRSSFASELANAILKNAGTESVVIGLYGPWGCGKTSLVNLVVEEIENLTNASKDKPLIVNFDPWYFSSEDNLVSAYFKTLRSSLNLEENSSWKKSIGEALDKYANAWDLLNLIPGAGPAIVPFLTPTIKDISKVLGEELSKAEPIEKAKLSIEKAIIKRNQKIIVVIDDIDRLDNSQIRSIFQLVKQIVSFPNTTFILPMDRDVVVRALKDVQGDDGSAYLEKIVQIPFVIPEISNTKLQAIFLEKLTEVLKNNIKTVINNKYWNSVFYGCVWPFIKNLRDINRVINTIGFKINLLSDEICVEDIIAVTTIGVLEPRLYSWIGENRNSLCGKQEFYISNREGNSDKIIEKYKMSLQETGIKNVERAILAVATMFPHFANEINMRLPDQSTDNLKKEMRIAEIHRAVLIFDLDKDNIEIPRHVTIDSLTYYSRRDYWKLLKQVNNEGHILYYLDEVNALIDLIPYERLDLIIRALWANKREFKENEAGTVVMISAAWKADVLIDKLLGKFRTKEEVFEIFMDFTMCTTVDQLEEVGEKINKIELAYGRLAGDGKVQIQNQIIDLDQLKKLERQFAKKALDFAERGLIFDGNSLVFVSYLWEAFNKTTFSEYVSIFRDNETLTLKFICRLAGQWTGTAGKGWLYNKKTYSKWIKDEVIYKRIEEYDKEAMKQDFNHEELVRIASFYLNYGKSDIFDHATLSEAEELLKEWKVV